MGLTAGPETPQAAAVFGKAAPASRGHLWTKPVNLIAALAAIFAFAAASARGETASETEFRPWNRASPFTLPALTGETIGLEAFGGRTVLVHFFATWCAPCRRELPALQRFAARAAVHGVTVLTVSVAEPDDRVRRFAAALPLALPVLLDRDRAVTRAFDVTILPSTVILGPDLSPRLAAEGDLDWDGITPGDLMARMRQADTRQNANTPQNNETTGGN